MDEFSKWDQLVIKAIIANKDCEITEVNSFESVKSLMFNQETYKAILDLINKKDWEKIEIFQDNNKERAGFGEYLDVIKFTDQNKSSYTTIIDDSEELWQDPQIIDIIPLI